MAVGRQKNRTSRRIWRAAGCAALTWSTVIAAIGLVALVIAAVTAFAVALIGAERMGANVARVTPLWLEIEAPVVVAYVFCLCIGLVQRLIRKSAGPPPPAPPDAFTEMPTLRVIVNQQLHDALMTHAEEQMSRAMALGAAIEARISAILLADIAVAAVVVPNWKTADVTFLALVVLVVAAWYCGRRLTSKNRYNLGFDVATLHHESTVGYTSAQLTGLALVDWDTVGLAAPERDLWMVDSGRSPSCSSASTSPSSGSSRTRPAGWRSFSRCCLRLPPF
jgi:hypothetical protein